MSAELPPESASGTVLEPSETHPATDDALPLDIVFDILSNRRRRIILDVLASEDEPTTLGALAELIASIENGKPEASLSSKERKRVYICLLQSHLPKMDDADVIDYDEDRKTVGAGDNLESVVRYLRMEDGRDGSTQRLPTAAKVADTASRLFWTP